VIADSGGELATEHTPDDDPESPSVGPEVGVIVALPSELRTLTSKRLSLRHPALPGAGASLSFRAYVYSAGMGAAGAEAACDALMRLSAVRMFVSWGVAAGLDPAAPPGTVIVADQIAGLDGDHTASQYAPVAPHAAAWADRVAARLQSTMRVLRGPIADATRVLESIEDKRELASATGAVAADMETAAIARFARGVLGPWLAIRVVADSAEMTLPTSAVAAVDRLGRMQPLAFARALARHPTEVVQMPGVARAFRTALESLRGARALLGDHFLAPGWAAFHDTHVPEEL
jgi:adenosylhomocysteine nucleosidase